MTCENFEFVVQARKERQGARFNYGGRVGKEYCPIFPASYASSFFSLPSDWESGEAKKLRGGVLSFSPSSSETFQTYTDKA